MKFRLWTLLLAVGFAVGQQTQNPCSGKQTCHECIQTSTCAWCADPGLDKTKGRCFLPNDNTELAQCLEEYIYNPDNELHHQEERPLSKGMAISGSSSGSSSGSYHETASGGSSMSASGQHHDAVQISPQKVGLKLRIGESYRISFRFAQAEDYPVDLYYLMDLSKSMEDDKDKLSSLGDLLAESMQNITTNFRLGFGSFVDKVVMPYVSVVPKNLIEPCPGCHPPYGFQNVMSLSTNTSRFSGEVRNAAVSGNLDGPEGGFDAIMQAVVCRNQIGWRQKARRLLVFSTDAGFHYAGDGKLGGIVKPNDGQCHLDETGLYTHSTLQDYPSISQINQQVKKNAINLIFAVTSEQIDVYSRLQKMIEGSSSGKLSADSANVVDLVKEQYNKITSSVELKDTASKDLKVTYYSNCLQDDAPFVNTNKCDGLKVGTKIEFQAEILVKSCPKDKSKWRQSFNIYPVGINESLTVNLEMLCDCPCENEGHSGYIEHADVCHGHGTYQCGVCACDPLHFGLHCECDENNRLRDGGAGCRPDNTTTVDCTGRGQCICGQCECELRSNPEEKIEGAFCECDNFSCDREGGKLCSGPDHGTCKCGKCDCEEGWSGPACGCSTSTDTCVHPEGGEVCSGKGVCECGVCKCNTEEEGRFSGRYCEKCPTCPGRCLELKDCIQCQVYKTGPLSEEECATNCTAFVPQVVDEIEEVDEYKGEHLCNFFDEDDCRFTFVYTYDEKGKLVVWAKKERECPPQVYILGIVLGVIGAIVLIGMAFLLLWKVLTTIHDRREFARFEKERKMAKWDTGENPIYKQATSTFKNPTYAGK